MRKKVKFALGCILGSAAAVCAAVGLSGCGESDTWNVSADSSSSVRGQLIETEGGTELRISGNGKMKDFEAGGAPWNGRSDEITSISIANGVDYIGAHAFEGIDGADYVILPSTVAATGENFAEDGLKIFVTQTDIDFAGGAPEELYTYREDDIVTNDRYWQSDKSSGNIIEDGEDLSSADDGKYWRYVSADSDEAMVYEKIKVLFIGNSFTYRNGVVEFSSGVPGLFDGVAEDLGFAVETYSITGPGWYLESHANASDTCGRQVDRLLNACDDFDYIVLQDQSTVSYRENSRFINGVNLMQSKINSTQTHAKVYLYETWGSPFSSNEDGTTIAVMENKIREAYTAAGEQFGLDVTYVGAAFTDVYYNNSSINLYDTDNRHQGFTGAYLSACTHVCSMLGADVRNTQFTGEGVYSAPKLEDETLEILREAAYKAATLEFAQIDDGQEDSAPVEDAEQALILKIAGWGRFISEKRFDALVADFKAYCDENSVEYTEIIGTYYDGATTSSPCYYIADFTAKVQQDGNPDIVLPCATNFNANQATLAAIEYLPIDVYNQSDRQVGALNESPLTMQFMDYAATQRADDILTKPESEFGQNDETTVPDEQENVLKIAGWGRFISEERFNALVADFKAYCDENGVEYTEIIGTYYDSSDCYLIADYTSKILADGGADIVLPCATNFNTNQSNMAAEQFVAIDVYGQENRQVGLIDADDALSLIFLEYIATDSAKTILTAAE